MRSGGWGAGGGRWGQGSRREGKRPDVNPTGLGLCSGLSASSPQAPTLHQLGPILPGPLQP